MCQEELAGRKVSDTKGAANVCTQAKVLRSFLCLLSRYLKFDTDRHACWLMGPSRSPTALSAELHNVMTGPQT